MKQFIISKNITTREYRSLDKYFNEVEKIAPVKPEEEAAPTEKIRLGDHVRTIARRFVKSSNLKVVV